MSESDDKAHLSPVSGGKRLSSGFKASPEGRRRSSAGGEKASSSGRPPRCHPGRFTLWIAQFVGRDGTCIYFLSTTIFTANLFSKVSHGR